MTQDKSMSLADDLRRGACEQECLCDEAAAQLDAMQECVEALKEFVAIAERSEPGVNINFAIALRKVKAKAALAKLEKANDHS